MTRRHGAIPPVPLGPSHHRLWRTLWRRCSCGLPAPCVDRRLPWPVPPYPRRGHDSAVQVDPTGPHAMWFDGGRVWADEAATRPAPILGRPVTPFPMWRDD